MKKETVNVLLKENRIFKASKDFCKSANIKDAALYRKAKKNPQKFWASCAQDLDWFKKWNKTLEWKPPFAKWFIGGT